MRCSAYAGRVNDSSTPPPAELPSLDAPLPEGDEKGRSVQVMFDTIAPRYDLVNRIMTFRLDVRWRRLALESLRLASGALVLDLATGTGDFCRELGERGHASVGADFSFGMLANARTSAPLVQADGMVMPFATGAFDAATCGFALRNFVDLQMVFDELGRVVKPGGRIALLDASAPDNKVAAAGHGLYFGKVVPFVGGLLSDKQAYGYLPRSLAYLPPRDELLSMLAAAGFVDVRHEQLTLGAAQLITGQRSEQ
ncbi:MAG: ubiquinone/menaquinone biosynthesis methyltransferase [Acidimicrobiales bacterium]|nr:MAG: ubiquinone/menaquinone biosynthesis methyltransferase [Acidimicrobiales bacterium]